MKNCKKFLTVNALISLFTIVASAKGAYTETHMRCKPQDIREVPYQLVSVQTSQLDPSQVLIIGVATDEFIDVFSATAQVTSRGEKLLLDEKGSVLGVVTGDGIRNPELPVEIDLKDKGQYSCDGNG